MAMTRLDRVQELVDQLTPLEQARLLEYITPRLTQAIEAKRPMTENRGTSIVEAWNTFFEIGDELIQSDREDTPTLTQAVLTMRR